MTLISTLIKNSNIDIKYNNDILNTTWPFVYNNIYNNYKYKDDILLLDFKYFCPLSLNEINNHLGFIYLSEHGGKVIQKYHQEKTILLELLKIL